MRTLKCVAGLLAAVGLVFLVCGAATAAEHNVPVKRGAANTGFDVSTYVAKGYSATGPIQVLSLDTKKHILTLYSQPKNIMINLQGRSVSVTNLTKSALSQNDLKKGTRVYVLQKGKEVVIVALPSKEARNDK